MYQEGTKLLEWQVCLKKILKMKPDDRTILWIWSKIGGVGKSAFAKWWVRNHEDAIIVGGQNDNVLSIIADRDTNGIDTNVVFWDVSKLSFKYLNYGDMECVKDMLFYSRKYIRNINGNCPHVVVFANESPDYSQMSEDRWAVVELGKKALDGKKRKRENEMTKLINFMKKEKN